MNDATQACKTLALHDILSNTNVDTLHPVNSVVSLPPFPRTSLPCTFHCITGIDSTYHPVLYSNNNKWMETILPLIRLLVSSFHLRNIFLFSHRDPVKPCPLEKLIHLLRSAIPTWFISNHTIFSHNLSDNISCSRSILYLQPLQPSSPIAFGPKYFPSYPNSVSWLSPTFSTLHFHHFATTNTINVSPSDSPDVKFYHPRFKGFVMENPDTIPSISNSIIDPLHPALEPPYNNCSDILIVGLVSLSKILSVLHMFVLLIPRKFFRYMVYLI